jgi:hypothetical protein
VIGDDVARWNAAHILFAVSMALAIPAVLGPVRLLGRRGAWFGLVDGTLAAVGVAFFGIFIGVELAMSAIASVPLEQRARLQPGMQALIDFGGPLPVVLIG